VQMQQALQALAPKPRRKGAGGGVTVSGAAACHVRVPAATAAQLTSLAPQSWRLLHVLQDKEKRKPGKTRVSSQTAALNAALAARRAAAGDTPARQPLAQVQNLPAQPEGGLGVLAEAAAGQENQDPLLPAVRAKQPTSSSHPRSQRSQHCKSCQTRCTLASSWTTTAWSAVQSWVRS